MSCNDRRVYKPSVACLTGCAQANFVYAGTCMRAVYLGAEQQVLPAVLGRRWN